MPTHVIVNLAEAAMAPTGVTTKVKDALEARSSTTERHGFLWRKTRTVSHATIHKYDLVEQFDEGKAGPMYGIDQDTVNDLKLKVAAADSVFYCAHGSATDADVVFTQKDNRIERLTDVARFAGFAKLILGKDKTHNVRLIVCFAARSINPDAAHDRVFLSSGANNYRALKSSLAYKFYKALVDEGIGLKLYARLGEVRVDPSDDHAMDILTQTEEGVVAGLNLGVESQTEQRLGKQVTDKRQMELRLKLQNDMDLGDLNDSEANWLEAYKVTLKLNEDKKQQGSSTGQGRLCYEQVGTDLRISFEGAEIYRGAYL